MVKLSSSESLVDCVRVIKFDLFALNFFNNKKEAIEIVKLHFRFVLHCLLEVLIQVVAHYLSMLMNMILVE